MPDWLDWKFAAPFVLAAGAIWVWARKQTLEPEGFRLFATNKSYRRWISQNFEEHQRRLLEIKESIDRLNESDINQLVHAIIRKPDDTIANFTLNELGERAIPALHAGLRHKSVWASAPSEGYDPNPLEAICDHLETKDLPQIVPDLELFLDHPNQHMRAAAAYTIASLPLDTPPDSILQYLANSTGLEDSILEGLCKQDREAGPIDGSYAKALYPVLAQMFDQTEPTVKSHHLVELMLRCNRTNAVARLTAPEILKLDNSSLHVCLRDLKRDEVPTDFFDKLVQFLQKARLNHSERELLGVVLKQMAERPRTDSKELMLHFSEYPNEWVQQDAVDALWLLTGGPVPWDELRRRGWEDTESLTEAERFFNCAVDYDFEVGNGGHAQYYINASGDGWKTARAALEAAHLTEHLAILRESNDLFGEQGPSEDREKRGEAMEALSPGLLPKLATLDSRYYQLTDSLLAKMSLYLLRSYRDF